VQENVRCRALPILIVYWPWVVTHRSRLGQINVTAEAVFRATLSRFGRENGRPPVSGRLEQAFRLGPKNKELLGLVASMQEVIHALNVALVVGAPLLFLIFDMLLTE
jgi:hypothetical protein